KDARPEDTIRIIRRILVKSGFTVEEISWKHPVPNVWSVFVRERGCKFLSANGKGETRLLALASALGEFMERLNTGYCFSHYSLHGLKVNKGFLFFPNETWFPASKSGIPDGILTSELRRLYDPDKCLASTHLIDRSSAGIKKGICAIPFTRTADEKKVFFPISILDNLYASNGMAAGNTPAEARVQALSEVLERYVKFQVIAKGLALPEIPKRYYAAYPKITFAIDALKQKGFGVYLYDASLGGRYPVITIALIDRDKEKCFLAFGAHPLFEVALSRTLTELLQGQDLRRFKGFQKPCARLADAADWTNLEEHFIDSSGLVPKRFFKKKKDFSFCYVNHGGLRKDELAYLTAIIHKAGKNIYIADFVESGFYTCRIVVPGMSEIYPAGNLVSYNANRGVKLCGSVMRLPKLKKSELQMLLDNLEAGYAGDIERVCHVLGIPFETGSPWLGVCFGELKMLVFFALNKIEEARRQLMWCLDTGCVRKDARLLYECVSVILDKNDCSDKKRLFKPAVIQNARRICRGENVFNDLFDSHGMPFGIRAHRELLKAFAKARKMRKYKQAGT
ncbi:MAG: YcaO-like family protein, partial [Candidatus Omnitrophica bacterium]|nr:YcaO-like family protein [Candidatus Omnitrophota bacterium]